MNSLIYSTYLPTTQYTWSVVDQDSFRSYWAQLVMNIHERVQCKNRIWIHIATVWSMKLINDLAYQMTMPFRRSHVVILFLLLFTVPIPPNKLCAHLHQFTVSYNVKFVCNTRLQKISYCLGEQATPINCVNGFRYSIISEASESLPLPELTR